MTQQEIQERNKQIIQMLGFKKGWWVHQQKPLTDDKKQWWDIDGKTFLGTAVYYDKDLKFHSDWNWLMEAVFFIKENIKSSSNTKDAKFGELFIDEWEFRVKSYYVRLIQWTKNGWRMPDRDDMELSLLYIIGENCESEKEALFLIVSDIAKLYNEKKL
jgi:hypothetical protein